MLGQALATRWDTWRATRMVEPPIHNGMNPSEIRSHVAKLAELDTRCTTLEKQYCDLTDRLDKIEGKLDSNRNFVIVTLGGVVVTLALEVIKYL
jgi:hypothetical protein